MTETDADFMLRCLQEVPGHGWSTMALIQRSIAERGHGLTPHSRASELRAHGHRVVCMRLPGPRGRRYRATYVYKLIAPLSEPSVLPGQDPSMSSPRAETATDGSPSGARSTPGARTTATREESAEPVSNSPSPLKVSRRTPATAAAAAEPETRPDTLFDVPSTPAWA